MFIEIHMIPLDFLSPILNEYNFFLVLVFIHESFIIKIFKKVIIDSHAFVLEMFIIPSNFLLSQVLRHCKSLLHFLPW